MFLTVTIDDDAAQSLMDYAGYKIRDARDPLRRALHEVIFPAIEDQFVTEGGRSGNEWEPLTPAYEKQKMKDGYGYEPIMVRTHLMKASFFAEGNNVKVRRDYLEYMPAAVEYPDGKKNTRQIAEYHQTGAGNNPQRPLVELTFDDEEQIHAIFDLWLDELRAANTRRGPAESSFFAPDLIFSTLGL